MASRLCLHQACTLASQAHASECCPTRAARVARCARCIASDAWPFRLAGAFGYVWEVAVGGGQWAKLRQRAAKAADALFACSDNKVVDGFWQAYDRNGGSTLYPYKTFAIDGTDQDAWFATDTQNNRHGLRRVESCDLDPETPASVASSSDPMHIGVQLIATANVQAVASGHAQRVEEWRAAQNGRVIFDRMDPSQELKPFELSINAKADQLLKENPTLMYFVGNAPKLNQLLSAAQTAVRGDGYSFARKSGSRAKAVAGQAGARDGGGFSTPVSGGGASGGVASTGGGSGGATSSSGGGGGGAKPACSVIKPEVRRTRLAELPSLIENTQKQTEQAQKLRDDCIRRQEPVEATKQCSVVDAKMAKVSELKHELRMLQQAEQKAQRDGRKSSAAKVSVAMDVDSFADTPDISSAVLGDASMEVVALTRSLAEQHAKKDSFSRENTRFGRLRVSPLTGIPIEHFVLAMRNLCRLRTHDGTTCTCSSMVKAAAVLAKLQGGRITLRDLWKQATGESAGTSDAQVLLDKLMRLPIVAVQVDTGLKHQTAWVVMVKDDGLDYSRLNGKLGALEPLSPHTLLNTSKPVIPTSRLRALKKLASSDADRKLIELAALDGLSGKATTAALGTNNLGLAAERAECEAKLVEALATFEAYDDLAKLQSLAQISSHIGRDIREEDVTEAMAQLEAALEPPLPSDEVASGIQYNVSSEVSYDTGRTSGWLS